MLRPFLCKADVNNTLFLRMAQDKKTVTSQIFIQLLSAGSEEGGPDWKALLSQLNKIMFNFDWMGVIDCSGSYPRWTWLTDDRTASFRMQLHSETVGVRPINRKTRITVNASIQVYAGLSICCSIGVTRFELAASWSQIKRPTKLGHTPRAHW